MTVNCSFYISEQVVGRSNVKIGGTHRRKRINIYNILVGKTSGEETTCEN
jgi:hypothetical protein